MPEQKQVRKLFISEHLDKVVQHGGIGNVDIEKILVQQGYQPIKFPYSKSFSFIAKVFRLLFLFRVFAGVRNSIVIYQFPLHAKLHRLLVRLLLSRKDVHVICHVSDVNGLKDGDAAVLRKEVAILRQHRLFLVHGENMAEWIRQFHGTAIMEKFIFFDFLAKTFARERLRSYDVVFAGNLAKSKFLSQLGSLFQDEATSKVRFHLYGAGYQQASTQNVIFKGTYDAYELPVIIEGSFGLVWDGDSIHGLGGSLGDYMRYISHHKLSLYILASLPMIVPVGTAAERIVKEFDIGISVSRLHDIYNAIDRLSDEHYSRMQNNMKLLASRIQAGDCLKHALENLEKRLG